VHPQPESYWGHVNPVGPRGVYDEAKRFSEALVMAYHRFHKLDTRIVRIFNTYGPRMRLNDGRALPAFMGQALRGEDITVFGDGSQTRSFCFVDDLVRGLETLMESPAEVTGPFNLGNPQEMAVETIALEILARTRSKSPLQFRPLPQDDPKRRRPVIDAAERRLGWRPRVSLKEGLDATIAYFALQLAGHAPTGPSDAATRNSSTTRTRLTLASQR
jgi:UDP-glucuronate decarboxylase